MSFPYLFGYERPNWPKSILPDQHFGIVLAPDDLFSAINTPVHPIFKLWWPKNTDSSIQIEKDKWQINIDVQHFAPDEITVKTANGYIVVEGKHEQKEDEHGYISRQFVRRFKVLEDTDPDSIESKLSSDGVLTVLASKKVDALVGGRNVPISYTGPVRKTIEQESDGYNEEEEVIK